ncbi:MAG: hypothetical protein RJB62_359 [Pseudomonadota bacterium]|jgi:hypothetical protein
MKNLFPDSIRDAIRVVVPVALALALLNIGLAHHNLWPTPWIRVTGEISLELLVLVMALTMAAWFGLRMGRAAQWVLAAIVFVLVLGRYADVTAPALFGRRIDLYWDSQHVPAVTAMALENRSAGSTVALVLGLVAAIAAVLFVLRLAVKALCRAADRPLARNVLMASSASLLALFTIGLNSGALTWERHFALPVTPVYVGQAIAVANRIAGNVDPNPAADTPLRPFAELNGHDVFVIFLESYGRVALDKEAYGARTRETLAALEEKLTAEGWEQRSGYVTSPTFGGASWLAHTSLVAGYPVETHDAYQAFQFAKNEQLVDRFHRAGYRSVLLTPGIRGPWPAGQSLHFDRIIAAADIPYSGPGFGFWNVPDQYSLDWLVRDEIETITRNPLFVMFPTVMSHFPFGPTPPYAEDWSRLNSLTPFDRQEVEDAISAGDALTGDREKAYLRAILYDLKTVGGFVAERAPAGAIVIALGDHQPPAVISGENEGWDVPIHVFARDPELLRAFDRAGFGPGMTPDGKSVGPMNEVTSLLLEALETPSPSGHLAGVE